MGDFDLKDAAGKTDNDRVVMQILYGLHTLAWFSAGVFALVALIINYLRRADETEPLYLAHHRYMIATFWWTLLWLVLLAPLWLLFSCPGRWLMPWFGCGTYTAASRAGCALETSAGLSSRLRLRLIFRSPHE